MSELTEHTLPIKFDIAGAEFNAWVGIFDCDDDFNYKLQSFFKKDIHGFEVNLWPLLDLEVSEEQKKQGDFETVNCCVDYEIKEQLKAMKGDK
jgi:hypothetical protein